MMFWRKKKNENDTQYATLNQRLFAVVIDAFLMLMLWMPLESMVMPLIYHDLTPTQELTFIYQQKAEPYIKDNKPADAAIIIETYREFLNNHSILSLVFEQMSELALFIIITFAFWIKKQATPGKMLLSLKIVDNKTLEAPTILQYIVRMCAYAISMLPLGLGIFYMVINKKKRAWHDYIAGTAVIKVKRGNAK